jgi:hypothetical protein
MSESREVIVAHTLPQRAATHVRSTLIQSSLATLRELGHFEAYLTHVDPAYRRDILETIAPTWLPIAVGEAHYRACDNLTLSDAQLLAMGEHVGDRMQGAFMETLTRAGRSLGLTPWVLLKRFDALWGRLFQGGSIELTKVGPKELMIEIRLTGVLHSAYFRQAFCGVVRAGYKYVGTRAAYVRIARWESNVERFVMRAAWVKSTGRPVACRLRKEPCTLARPSRGSGASLRPAQ